MNRKVYRWFSAVMVLVLAVTLSGIGLIQGAAPAEAVTALKWIEIETPGQDDMQLLPASDVGVIAVSPDGATLFAAVYETSGAYPPGGPAGNGWRVFKSIDGGYTWRETGFYDDVVVGGPDTSNIVDMAISPLWENKQYLYVATQDNVWWSSDGGNNFGQMGGSFVALPNINCMDVGVDEDGLIRVVVGNGPSDGSYDAGTDVYLLVYDTWVPQQVHVNLDSLNPARPVDAVLDVGFAPTYGDEALTGYGWIFALVRGLHVAPPYTNGVDQAILRCESQPVENVGDVGNWGSPVQDAYFYHNSAAECAGGGFASGILATRGRMAFADDFADMQSVFVGMTAWDCTAGTDPRGDAFRVDVGTGIIYPSTYEDLNIRGSSPSPTECNVWSIDVSGDASTAYILAGLHETSTSGAPTSWQSGVHFSDNGGTTWMPSFKPPSGVVDLMTQWNEPELAMAPDFSTSGIAYCGTYGGFSGFWVSTTEGTTWNGRGLLDMATISISSIAVSPNYASDENMFMVEQMTLITPPVPLGALGILWETQDAGNHWEVILAMNALFPLPGVHIEWVELPENWPADNSIFVTGRYSVQPSVVQSVIIRSADAGNTFTTFIQGPQDPPVPTYRPPFVLAAWDTPDIDTIFVGDGNGGVWYTDNAGMQWHKCQSSVIPVAEAITDLVEKDGALLIGTENGGVYICYDWQADFSIERVGNYVGTTNDWVSVAFDAEYDLNDTIYCGLNDITPATGNGEVWRCNLAEGTTWEQISDIANTLVPEGWGLAAGTLFGTVGNDPMWVGSWNDLDPIPPGADQGGNALMCGEEGTLYAIDNNNGLGWRCTDPELEIIHLGTEPLWEPLGDGLGWPSAIGNAKVLSDLEVVTGSNILFAIGRDGANLPTIWTYHDTLTSDLGPLDLIRPTDGAVGVGTLAADKTQACLVLQWEPATGATEYEWEIGTSSELTVDGGFISLWAHYAFLGEAAPLDTQRYTNGEAIQGCLPPGETYYWHVRVVQPFQSPWSEIWSYTTLYTSASEKPVPISPTGGAVNVSLKPSLQWQGALDADEYELIVALECNWGSPVIEKSGDNALGAETAYQITQNLQYGKNYCWKVRAIKGTTASVWSDTGTFTTLAQPEEEEEEGTPYWVWVVIGVSALMLIAVIVLIVLTKKA